MSWQSRLDAEAKRIYLRYVVEFVEAFKLCPWAESARRDGATRMHVVLEDAAVLESDPTSALDAIGLLSEDESVAVGFVIFPRLRLDRPQFEALVARWRRADEERQGGTPAMAVAAFHPAAPADTTDGARLVPFIRRSPDPTIQCVRCAALAEVRRHDAHGTDYVDPSTVDLAEFLARPAKPPLHQRVADANRETLLRVGLAQAESILEAICADRDRAYAEILEGADSAR